MLKLKIVYIHLRGTWNFKYTGCLYNIIYSPGGDDWDKNFVGGGNKDKNKYRKYIDIENEREDKNIKESKGKRENRNKNKRKRENKSKKESGYVENIVYKCESGGVAQNHYDYIGEKSSPVVFLVLII